MQANGNLFVNKPYPRNKAFFKILTDVRYVLDIVYQKLQGNQDRCYMIWFASLGYQCCHVLLGVHYHCFIFVIFVFSKGMSIINILLLSFFLSSFILIITVWNVVDMYPCLWSIWRTALSQFWSHEFGDRKKIQSKTVPAFGISCCEAWGYRPRGLNDCQTHTTISFSFWNHQLAWHHHWKMTRHCHICWIIMLKVLLFSRNNITEWQWSEWCLKNTAVLHWCLFIIVCENIYLVTKTLQISSSWSYKAVYKTKNNNLSAQIILFFEAKY